MGDKHYVRPQERPFLRAEREHVTVLCGGLAVSHEQLVEAGLRELGYRCEVLPTTDLEAYALGRTHCSNGLCNPAYFTIGNLLKYLDRVRREQGLSAEEVCARYVFYTAGSYGPCRFGMYESEYRLALESAGYKGFRVFVFQQREGMVQSGWDDGLDFTFSFFLVHFKAFFLGDIVNELFHRLRPYELVPGAAARAREAAVNELRAAMTPPPPSLLRRAADLFSRLTYHRHRSTSYRLRLISSVTLLVEHLRSDDVVKALARAARHFDAVECDWLRLKPVVKVTGEFWGQTTEGDGNFRMFDFLEREGAEILVEPLATWVHYLVHVARLRDRETAGLPDADAEGWLGRAWSRARNRIRQPLKRRVLDTAMWIVEREYDRLRGAVGDVVLPLADQAELEALGAPFYDPRLQGGEGHLEVGKTIHYTQEKLAHMVLSLKPFGCMPSTQSDGTQPAVLAAYPDVLFLPVETSADGEVGALSRVQMMLAETRARARAEWQGLIARSPYSLDDMRGYAAAHPELRRGLLELPRTEHGVATALRFAALLDVRMRADAVVPARRAARLERADAGAHPAQVHGDAADAQLGGAA